MAGGRPKGAPNKRSQMLLRKLEDDHKFHVIKELLEIYGYNKNLYVPLFETMINNVGEGKKMTCGMDEDEVNLFQMLNKELLATLQRLLAYLYPKLKALEVGSGTGDKVIFNISGIPDVGIKPEKNSGGNKNG
jgi:hypothetical protein